MLRNFGFIPLSLRLSAGARLCRFPHNITFIGCSNSLLGLVSSIFKFHPSIIVAGVSIISQVSQMQYKVTVAGASGGVGQPLSMMLKQNNLISQLALYDVDPIIMGVAVDLSHMNTTPRVTGYCGTANLSCAMLDADLVIVSASKPFKLGMSREDIFRANAVIVCELMTCVAQHSPKAIIAIITDPMNALVPAAAGVLKKAGVYDPKRLLGVTTLDTMRAATFIAEVNGIDPSKVCVPVIGGHSGATIVPLLSQSQPVLQMNDRDGIAALTKRVQNAADEVEKAKACRGTASLSMAFAAARLANSVLRGLTGERDVIECAYVNSSVTEAEYFANPVVLGRGGVITNLSFGTIDNFEKQFLKNAMPELICSIKKGEDFVNKHETLTKLS